MPIGEKRRIGRNLGWSRRRMKSPSIVGDETMIHHSLPVTAGDLARTQGSLHLRAAARRSKADSLDARGIVFFFTLQCCGADLAVRALWNELVYRTRGRGFRSLYAEKDKIKAFVLFIYVFFITL